MMRRVCRGQVLGQGHGQVGVALHIPPDGHQKCAPGLVGYDLVDQAAAVHLFPALLDTLTLGFS